MEFVRVIVAGMPDIRCAVHGVSDGLTVKWSVSVPALVRDRVLGRRLMVTEPLVGVVGVFGVVEVFAVKVRVLVTAG